MVGGFEFRVVILHQLPTKAIGLGLFCYLPIAGERRAGFILFVRVLALSEYNKLD